MRRIAIVGSRTWEDHEQIKNFVRQIPKDCEFVSGGARGVDSIAESEARVQGLKCTIFKPKYDQFPNRVAPFMRNTEIVEHATEVYAFWDGESGGTRDTIDKARRAKKLKAVYYA